MSGRYRTARTAQVAVAVVFMATSIALGQAALAQDASINQQHTPAPSVTVQQMAPDSPESRPSQAIQSPPGGVSLEDLLLQKGTITKDEWLQIRAEQEYKTVEQARRLDNLEEWKIRSEVLPILRDKVNIGLNSLQFLYGHVNANVPEGKSQDSLSIRRGEVILWGKLSDYLPRWHLLFEFQSTGLINNTPTGNGSSSSGTPSVASFFREAYIDVRPVQSWAPNLNIIRMGVFRMPFGIFTETSGGLRDVISTPYLNYVGSGRGNPTGSGGAIDFLQERDYFVDVRGTLFKRLEYVVGIMNNNNFSANGIVSTTTGIGGANSPKAVYTRIRLLGDNISFISFNMIQGTSNNAGTLINGRGKGHFDRYGVDFRYNPTFLPNFVVYGEYWQGHDGANATTVGTPANGACLDTAVCGGSGAPGVQRRTWYVLAKYLFTEGPLENFEPVFMYEQFDPNTRLSNDLYTRQIVGLTYYFENFPPKMQSKIQFNYEFRHHAGNGPGINYDSRTDPFANNAFFLQFQLRYM
ncbi:MAG: hypothetical protein LV473_20280 [Nitrospira sp.]|nr:hypothetical protein [Nitrospira sp.]